MFPICWEGMLCDVCCCWHAYRVLRRYDVWCNVLEGYAALRWSEISQWVVIWLGAGVGTITVSRDVARCCPGVDDVSNLPVTRVRWLRPCWESMRRSQWLSRWDLLCSTQWVAEACNRVVQKPWFGSSEYPPGLQGLLLDWSLFIKDRCLQYGSSCWCKVIQLRDFWWSF